MWEVIWEESSLNELADRWRRADSTQRRAITRAAQEIDDRLAWAPYEDSESREEGRRILFNAPLAVIYEVDQFKHEVHILHTWTYLSRE